MNSRYSLARKSLYLGAVAAVALMAATPALAQSFSTDTAPPVHAAVDGNGVDLTSGAYVTNAPQVSVGPEGQGGCPGRSLQVW